MNTLLTAALGAAAVEMYAWTATVREDGVTCK